MDAETPKLRFLYFCWEQHANSREGMRHSARPFQCWRLILTLRDAIACAWHVTGGVLPFKHWEPELDIRCCNG